MSKPGVRLTLYGRAYCHLCEEMLAALQAAPEPGIAVDVVDVDADPVLEARYGERVPVLMGTAGEICHYRLDRDALAAYLLKIR